MRNAAASAALLVLWLIVAGCSPQAALIAALTPANAVHTVLGNFEKVSDTNRKRVIELEQAGRWQELLDFARENVSRDRSNAEWWLIAGYASSQLKQYGPAVEAYREAVRLDPQSAAGWNLLAQAHRAAGDSRQAINVLNNALLALRDAPMTLYLLGESHSDLRQFQQATMPYREALTIEPRFPAAWFGLARAYAALGRDSEAREARAQLEKLDPKLARHLDAKR